ncbi:MAG: hypothetical protein ABI699_09350 [Caldimonas sp.]
MQDARTEGRLFSLELIFSVMLAGADRQDRGVIDRMHSVLSDRIRTSAANVAATQELPEAAQMAFVEAACEALDSVLSTARVLR